MEDFEFSRTLIWAVLGLVLIISEIVTGTFFLLFFGVSALVVALLRVIFLDHTAIEVILFSVIGIACVLVFRSKIVDSLAKEDKSKSLDTNAIIRLSNDLASGGENKIEYRGTLWTAVNTTNYDFKKGEEVLIKSIEGIKLYIDVIPDEE